MQVVTAGIELERGSRQMPFAPQAADERLEARRRALVVRELAEQAPAPFERGFRPAHARACELRGEHAAVRRPARVQRFDRGSVAEEFHDARRLAERDAERGDGLGFVQALQFRGYQRGCEPAGYGSGLKALRMEAARRR